MGAACCVDAALQREMIASPREADWARVNFLKQYCLCYFWDT
jgi:hypothetical protein